MDTLDIKILVACHNDCYVPQNKYLYPIQVGCALTDKKIDNMLYDNEVDNISIKNKSFCELTAIYWAWKNLDADYYGLFHYRRYLTFNKQHLSNNKGYYKTYNRLSESSLADMCLDELAINDLVKDYDIIIPTANFIGESFKNNYEQYCKSQFLKQKDIDLFLKITQDKYPHLKKAIASYMNSRYAYFCNIGIFKKEYYNQYCNMLFDIMFEVEKQCDTTNYSLDEFRVFGHLAERFLGIMIHYWYHDEKTKIFKLRMVLIENSNSRYLYPIFKHNTIAIALSSNNFYSPYLAVTIQSIIENSDNNYNYDIIIIDGNILESNKNKILSQVKNYSNISIRYYDTKLLDKGFDLPTKQHMSIETWYRLFLPTILPKHDKIIYLDCDLIVNSSLIKLYNTNIDNYLLAATRDLPLVGLYKDNHFKEYFKNILKLKYPLDYLQAGVLLLNLKKFREKYKLTYLLNLAISQDWKWLDQDVLNVLANENYYKLKHEWNVEINRANIRIKQIRSCPIDYYLEYMEARKSPKIVHFSGEQKPWAIPEIDMSEYFWLYAKKSAFYELILFNVMNSKTYAIKNSLDNKLEQLNINFKNSECACKVGEKNMPIKKSNFLVNKIKSLPKESKFRLFAKRAFYWFKKDLEPIKNEYWTINSDVEMHNIITKRKIKKTLGLNRFDKKMKEIYDLKKAHNGERCFIVCTGPSLKMDDLQKIKNEMTFGVNSIVRAYKETNWRPTYYVLVDYYAFGEYLKTNNVVGNKLAERKAFLHYRVNLKNPMGNEIYVPIHYKNHTEKSLKNGTIKFSKDPSVCIYDGFTVTNMAIQLAIFMGFKEIYIIGADSSYNPQKMHFIETPGIDEKQKKSKNLVESLNLSIKGYKEINKFAKKHNVKIYNASRGGHLEVFERVNFDTFNFK